jgi:hypothetical protein
LGLETEGRETQRREGKSRVPGTPSGNLCTFCGGNVECQRTIP